METLYLILVNIDAYSDRGTRVKAVFLYSVILLLAVFISILATIGIASGFALATVVAPVMLVILGITYFLVRSGYIVTASWLLIGAMTIALSINNLTIGALEPRALINGALLMILAGFLLSDIGITLLTLYAILQVIFIPAITGVDPAVESEFAVRFSLVIIYLVMGIVIYSFRQFVVANRQEGEDIAGRERMKLADVNMQITRQAATRTSLDDALNNTLALILDTYPQLYHAQVFLLDADGIQAKLQASTGEAGQQLLARNHSLAVGSLSVIGQTTLTGEPVVAITNDPNSVHKVNELLPETTLEAAFPLQVEDKIIGALDLQSKTLTALSEDDRVSFQSLSNSLALAIDNIQQFAAAQERIEENEHLTKRTQVMLSEVERLNRRLIGRAWAEYTAEHSDSLGYEVNVDTKELTPYRDWSMTLQQAVKSGEIVRTGDVISVPLRIRGEVIGAMEFDLDGTLSDEQVNLITEVTERFGLAAENTRLVEESQRAAHRETLINQITSRFQAAQNVESTLTEAARSLSETLNAEKVMIRLGLPDKATPNGHQNGQDS